MNAMVPVSARFDPFEPGSCFAVRPGMTVAEIIAAAPGVPEWFHEFGTVALNGEIIPPANWPRVRPKTGTRDRPIILELRVVPMQPGGGGGGSSTKNILTTVAVIGLIAATGFVGAGGIAFAFGLGATSTFAAGGLGAALAAAGLGVVGQLAIQALTPPAPTPKGPDGAGAELSQAGIAGNQIAPLETLPGILGQFRVSPPLIAPPYTTFLNGVVTAHAVFGWGNRCSVADILLNGADSGSFEDVTIQTREGAIGDAILTICDKTVLEQRVNTELLNFRTLQQTNKNDRLVHQSDPDSDLPAFQVFRTRRAADELWIRLVWPGGMLRTDTSAQAFIPIRIEMRLTSSSTWLKLPVFHFTDARKGKQFRQQIRLIFGYKDTDGASSDTEQAAFAAYYKTASGQTYEYVAEACFSAADFIPTMTSGTTSGVTMSASTTSGASAAWKAGDKSTGTSWVATTTSGWLQVQLASAKRAGAYYLHGGSLANLPKNFTFEGSNDGAAWTVLDTQTNHTTYIATDGISEEINIPAANRGSYLYYRINVSAVNAGGTAVQLIEFRIQADATGYHDTIFDPVILAAGVNSTDDGFDIYLDPTTFPAGDYEVRVQRGLACAYATLTNISTYYFGGGADSDDLFSYHSSGGFYVVEYSQKLFSSDTLIEIFSTYTADYPFASSLSGVGMIAVEAPNLQLQSVSALLTSYAAIFSGGIWLTVESATQNPAALYRKVLLGSENALALPGEIIDEDNLATWYAYCVAQGYECNAIAQGLSVEQVLQLIAAAGWAVPRQSALWGVIYERDRSAESITQLFSSRNTKNLGTSIDFPTPVQAVRAEYFDESNDFQVTDTIIYLDGFDANNAKRIDAITYSGITNATAIAARALLDLRQLRYRQAKHVREVAFEVLASQRGDLVGVSDDVLLEFYASSIIASVQTSGGNVTGITLEATVDLSLAQNEVMAVDDVTAVTDVTATTAAMGVAIRGDTGAIINKAINEVAATNVLTFVTPFATPSDIVAGCLVTIGKFGQEYSRKIIFAIEPGEDFTARVTLVDEAPEIHA